MSRFSILKSNKVLAPPTSPITTSPSPSTPVATEQRRFGFRPQTPIEPEKSESRQSPIAFEPRKSSGIFNKPVPTTPTEPTTAAADSPRRQFGLKKVSSNESIHSEVSERRVFDKTVFGSNTGMSAFSSKPRVKREDNDMMPKELEITDENSFIFKAIAKKYGLAIKEEIKLESMIQFPSLGPPASPSPSPMQIDPCPSLIVVEQKKNMWSKIAAKKVEEPIEEVKEPETPRENCIVMDLHALVNSPAVINLYKSSSQVGFDWSNSNTPVQELEQEPIPVEEPIAMPIEEPAPVVPKPKKPDTESEPLTGKQKALNSFFKKKK